MRRLRIVGDAFGGNTPFDGQYLAEYDPERPGVAPDGRLMLAHVVCTHDPDQAMQFVDGTAALECWRLVSLRLGPRPDGEPNRPLTAFSVEVV